jgi:N-acetylmuramoyl-L-alanine amidase
MGLLIVLAGCSTAPRAGYPPSAPAPGPFQKARTTAPPQKIEFVREAPHVVQPRIVAPEPPRPRTNNPAETWIPLNRWVLENRLGSLRQVASAQTPTFALVTTNGILFISANSQVARWDGLELHLGFEPQLINGQPFVHTLDLKKNIGPLLRGTLPPAKTNRVVVIDPGHGGQKTGATSIEDDTNEKDLTLDWARRLAPLLAAGGWQVFLTRTNDQDVSLSNRVAFAEERKADLFISLHFNSAAPSQEQAGVETFFLTPAGMPSTLTRGYEDDPSLVFFNNAFDSENVEYAFRLHRALVHVTGKDRGLRRARFLTVLQGQNRPAILIEGGYLSNPREARQISDPAFRQQLAEALARALNVESGMQMAATAPQNQATNQPVSPPPPSSTNNPQLP